MTLAVHASGLVTALGYNAPASLAAMRAGLSSVAETRWHDFETGKPLRGAKVALPQWWDGVGKLAELLAPAVWECLQPLGGAQAAAKTPLLIGVSVPQRPGRAAGLDCELLPEVCARLGCPVHPRSRLFVGDQVGAWVALAQARQWLDAGELGHVVVAGVDSYLSEPTLHALADARRLHTSAQSNGFFPGEAAAAVLVGRATGDDELQVVGWGHGVEPATLGNQLPQRAQGLTEAVRLALADAGVGLNQVAYRLTDLSGEHHKFKEAAFVAGRLNGGERSQPLGLWHPIEYLGEVGAAILPCLLAQALHAGREGYAPGPLALCHVGSDAGARAALVLRHRGQVNLEWT